MEDYPEEIDDLIEDEDEEVDSDGQPLPTPEEVVNIINAIPSFKFEEASQSDTVSDASSVRMSA